MLTCPSQQIQEALNAGEKLGPSSKSVMDLLGLPKFIKKILSYFSRLSDPMFSQLYDILHRRTIIEDRNSVAARDRFRAEWHRKWTEEGLDFTLTAPLSLPVIENAACEKTTLMCVGFTLLFSLV